MTPRALARLLQVYLIVLGIVCIAIDARVAIQRSSDDETIDTIWRKGVRLQRHIPYANDMFLWTSSPEERIVVERIEGEAPIVGGAALLPLALVPGRDGVKAELDGRVAYATVDDLLSAEAYDRGGTFLDASLGIGTHRAVVTSLLAAQLGASPADVERRARLSRVRFERPRPPSEVSRERVLASVRAGAEYLARAVDDRGKFRYVIDAPTNKTISGYSWPRHAGATYFLAQAAALFDDPEIRFAALRAAALVRDEKMVDCGAERCVTDWDEADVGSSALTLVAFVELVRTGADGSYRPAIERLASFLRSMQRPDGEFMHVYLRGKRAPKDIQLMYFTGEAALALARAHRVTNDPRDLEASKRALDYLATKAWSFFGSRYFWAEEHWTCQAMDDLWERAPNEDALRFCLAWHEFQRRLQHDDGDSPFDADGAFGAGFLFSPRTTPAASRGEAAGATLAVVRRDALRDPRRGANAHRDHAQLLDDELRRSIAFLLRHQFLPGPTHLFADPPAVRGGMPGSPVDWQLRIDYVQHAGSAMIRWLSLGNG